MPLTGVEFSETVCNFNWIILSESIYCDVGYNTFTIFHLLYGIINQAAEFLGILLVFSAFGSIIVILQFSF